MSVVVKLSLKKNNNKETLLAGEWLKRTDKKKSELMSFLQRLTKSVAVHQMDIVEELNAKNRIETFAF